MAHKDDQQRLLCEDPCLAHDGAGHGRGQCRGACLGSGVFGVCEMLFCASLSGGALHRSSRSVTKQIRAVDRHKNAGDQAAAAAVVETRRGEKRGMASGGGGHAGCQYLQPVTPRMSEGRREERSLDQRPPTHCIPVESVASWSPLGHGFCTRRCDGVPGGENGTGVITQPKHWHQHHTQNPPCSRPRLTSARYRCDETGDWPDGNEGKKPLLDPMSISAMTRNSCVM